jgi:hypothetical protein
MKLLLPERKRLDIHRLCKAALKASSLSRKELEKIIGNLNWATAAVDFAQAHYRGLQFLLNSRQDAPCCELEDVYPLSKEARADLYWWISEANFSAGRSLTFPVPDVSIPSDASLSGWGAVCMDVSCLTKIRQEQAEIDLVAPYWPSQFWFPSLMELATDIPVLLFPSKSLLTSPLGECHPLTVSEAIRLIARRLSGDVLESAAFRQKLSSSRSRSDQYTRYIPVRLGVME